MKIGQLINSRRRIGEIIRFGIVGSFSSVVQYAVYICFAEAIGIPATVSTIISYVIAFVGNFFLSSYFTFHSRPNALKGLGFAASHAVNMGLQVGLVAIFQQLVGKALALLPAMAICIPVNYLMVRYAFTSRFFKSKKEKHSLQK